jgi:FtsH-binding integral membrane protein
MSFNAWGERAMEIPSLRVEVRPLFRLVYLWMGLGLLVTTVISLVTATAGSPLNRILYTTEPGVIGPVPNIGIFLVAIIAELGMVVGLSWSLRRISPNLAMILFFVYAALNGFTLSLLVMVYADSSLVTAFASAAALFGVMSVVGYTTQADLTQYRTYFMMGLIGLIVAMIVNIFLQSSVLEMLLSLFGVVLFTALTAYDTQKIKQIAADPNIQADGSLVIKLSIMGALALYLDFINLFIFLLRLFGRRR